MCYMYFINMIINVNLMDFITVYVYINCLKMQAYRLSRTTSMTRAKILSVTCNVFQNKYSTGKIHIDHITISPIKIIVGQSSMLKYYHSCSMYMNGNILHVACRLRQCSDCFIIIH